MVLEAIGYGAGAGAVADLKAVPDPVAQKNLVKLLRVAMEAVLVALAAAEELSGESFLVAGR